MPEIVPAGTREAEFQEILAGVQRPLRYIGGEWNEIVKDHDRVDLTFALAFPDVYEIGMSHLGFRILYSLLNAREDTAAERVFCPWPDMADALRARGRTLATLETGTPLRDLDVVGFSLQYEMTFTNVLEMLDLAGIPLRSADRSAEHPLVVVGGPVVFNAEPLADFVDAVFVGDGEEMIPEFLDRLKEWKSTATPRSEVLRGMAGIEGIYVPSLYDVEAEPRNGLLIPIPKDDGVPHPVMRRIVMDLDEYPFPDRIIVPHGEIVHDRVSVEIMRGCPVGCRFCQAGYVYRPTRERDPNQIRDTVIRSVRSTGYDSFSLSSLNTGEYGDVHPLMFDLMERFEPERVSISMSSMHASTINEDLAREARRVRKSGFTIAPEAGSQRMRNVINKNLDEAQILEACRLAFEAGWNQIKLYFMIGLPTETDEDVDAQVDLAHKILDIGRKVGNRKRVEVTLSASSFIPKPETPFQWLGMDRIESLYRKQDRIASRVRRGVRFKHHECETSYLEGVFSRGDRSLGPVLERAWRDGARFDGWSEHFRHDVWMRSFEAEGVDHARMAHGEWDPRDRLPWQVVHSRVNRKWLAIELQRAREAATLSVCGPTDCHGCAPFAKECVKGIVAETTDRPLDADLPLLSTPAAPGPGAAACADVAPQRPEPRTEERATPLPAPEGPRYRYRARFEKTGRTRFLGHLDVSRMLMRALRRSGVPLVYSQGFNPKPRVGFGPALPVGVSSEGEYIDLESHRRLDVDATIISINAALPAGVRFLALREIRRDERSLGDVIVAARYRVHLPPGADAPARVTALRDRGTVEVRREHKGKIKVFDLWDEVLDLDAADAATVRMTLAVRTGGSSIKPIEVLAELLGSATPGVLVVREDLLADVGGRQVNPILAASRAFDARRAAS